MEGELEEEGAREMTASAVAVRMAMRRSLAASDHRVARGRLQRSEAMNEAHSSSSSVALAAHLSLSLSFFSLLRVAILRRSIREKTA